MNTLITTIKDNESVILKLLTNKSAGPGHFPAEFYPIFTEGLMPFLLKLFQNNRTEGNISKLILQHQHYSDTKTKDTTIKENYKYP